MSQNRSNRFGETALLVFICRLTFKTPAKMELLIAILIALGSLTSADGYTSDYELNYQSDIEKAKYIMDNGDYTTSKDGGVVIDQDIDG